MRNQLLVVITVMSILISSGLIASDEKASTNEKIFKTPVVLTSSGQAADVLIMKGLCRRAGLEVNYLPQANKDDLDGFVTLVIVAGGSSKGLGAAKINPKAEQKRVQTLLKSANKRKIPVLMFHIGGEARRGVLSDPFNELAAFSAEKMVVLSAGDKDSFFKNIAELKETDYLTIEKQIDAIPVIQKLFGLTVAND